MTRLGMLKCISQCFSHDSADFHHDVFSKFLLSSFDHDRAGWPRSIAAWERSLNLLKYYRKSTAQNGMRSRRRPNVLNRIPALSQGVVRPFECVFERCLRLIGLRGK